MKKEKTVLIIATLDTKGLETQFLKNHIEERGLRTLVMDIGTTGESLFNADIPSHKVAEAASRTLEELLSFNDEAKAMAEMAKGAESIVQGIFKTGAFDGAIAIGGSMGSSLALRVFRGLPTGLTKVLLSTVALSDFVTPQSVMNDVVLVQATCDLWGMNRLERRDLKKAALIVASMVEGEEEPSAESAPLISLTTLGGSLSHICHTGESGPGKRRIRSGRLSLCEFEHARGAYGKAHQGGQGARCVGPLPTGGSR